MNFIYHFTCITKICTIYLQQNQYISSLRFSRCQYIPETLMQKNNIRIIDNDMRIKWVNFWEALEGIISKILSIPYSGKVWWGKSLAKLANLAKLQVIRQLKPAKFPWQIGSTSSSSKSSTFAKLFLVKTSRCPIRQTFPPPNFPAIRY